MHIFKNLLTNPDPKIQDKARYFADCFEFILNNMGKYDFPSMENHRSLLEKIRFQLVNYDPQHSGKYIQHFAKHPFLNKKDEIMKSYYDASSPLVQKLRSCLYKENTQRESFILEVDAFIAELQHSLMKNAMEEIHSVLHCDKVLCEHNHPKSLDYATGIIISEFRFTGFKVNDIDRLFERILSNDIKFVKGRPTVEFPLPAKLLEDKFIGHTGEQYQQALQSFMETRSLREQFEGISNLYDNTQAINKVLFRISNLHSKKKVNKSYGAVRLTTSVKSYFNLKSNERVKEYIKENGLYFEVTVHSTNINAGQLLAADLIRKELPMFEMFYGTNIIVDYGTLLMKLNGHTQMKQSMNVKWLPDINSKKSDIEKKLNRLTSKASFSFKQLEIIYAQAKTAQLPEQKLNHYWRYLEACRGNQKISTEQLLQKLAEIMSIWGLNGILFNYYQIGSDILWANRDGIHGDKVTMSYREIMDFLDINTVQVGWVNKANEILNHPFLKYRSRRTLQLKISDALAEMTLYHGELLFEAYEQRNFIQHGGIFHPMAVEKLLLTIPGMIDALRAALRSLVLKNRYENISEIVQQLTLPPAWMAKMIERDQCINDW